MAEFTAKQSRFIQEYLIDLNGTQAAIRAEISKRPTPPSVPYVYSLTDPITNEVFYIGKGKKNRMYQHERDAKNGELGRKCERIRKIIDAGLSVKYSVLGEYKTDKEAYSAEKKFIADHVNLTNIASGGGGEVVSYKEKAENLLSKLRPFNEWVSEMPSEILNQVNNVFGSPKLCYCLIINSLESVKNSKRYNLA